MPLAEEVTKVRDVIQLSIVGCSGSVLEGASKDRHCVEELVLGRERRLGEVGVAELNSVGELLALGVFSDDREGAIMMEGGTNVKIILAAEVPRGALAGLCMDKNTATEGANGSSIVIEATIKIFPG